VPVFPPYLNIATGRAAQSRAARAGPHNPPDGAMPRQTVFGAVVPARAPLPICGGAAAQPEAQTRLPASTCRWGAGLPPELLAMIADRVLQLAGSDGLVAMAGVCAAWRTALLDGPESPLALTLKLFRCRRIQAIGQDFLLTNMREHRVSVFDENFFISPVAQAQLLAPKPWPPASTTAEALARALFEPFPGLLFVRRTAVTAVCDRSLDRIHAWRAAKDAVVDVVSPLLPRWFVALGSRRQYTGKEQYWLPHVAPMPRVFDETVDNPPPPGNGTRMWEFSLCEPLPETADGQAPKLENRLVFSFQARAQRSLLPGVFPPGTTALGTVLSIDKDRPSPVGACPATPTASGRVYNNREREASAVIVFFRPPDMTQEEQDLWSQQAFAVRPYLKSPEWVQRRTFRWREAGTVLCAFVVLAFWQEVQRPVVPNTDMLFPVRSLPVMARRATAPAIGGAALRLQSVFPAPDPIGFGGHQWSSEYAPVYYRFLVKKQQLARRFARLHSNSRVVQTQIMENSLAANNPLRQRFADFWLSQKLSLQPCDWTAKPPAVVFFGTKAWFAWAPGQTREKVADSTAGRYKTCSNKTLIGFGNNPIRNNKLPADLNNSHFANIRNYLSITDCIFGPPHMAISVVGFRPETMAAFVPNTDRRFRKTFPVLARFKRAAGASEAAVVADVCRRMAETSAPFVRVPIAFILPDAGTPGVVTLLQASGGTQPVDPAWNPDEDAAGAPAASAPLPWHLKIKTEHSEFRSNVHHVARGYADTTVCYGTIAARDVTMASGDNLLYIFPILEIVVNDEHSTTTMGVCMTALDWLAWKLFDIGRFDWMNPALIGVVSHMALALTLPENGSPRSEAYARMAEAVMAQRRNARGPVNPFEPPPGDEAPTDLRFKHPLSVDAPTVRRAFTLPDVAPLLEAYMQELIARVVLADPAHGEPGWLWALNRRFIARVSTAFDLWAVFPLHYYNRVMLLSARAERDLRQ